MKILTIATCEYRSLYVMDFSLIFLSFRPFQNQTHTQNANQNNQIAVKMGRGKGGPDAKPRGRMTAYAFFVQTCREEHKKKHPEESVIFAEFSRKCAERWKVRNCCWSNKNSWVEISTLARGERGFKIKMDLRVFVFVWVRGFPKQVFVYIRRSYKPP